MSNSLHTSQISNLKLLHKGKVRDIYAVGETTGIAGAGKSLIEGQIAAWDFLYRQGRVNRKDLENQIGPLMSQRGRQLQYGRFINHSSFAPYKQHSALRTRAEGYFFMQNNEISRCRIKFMTRTVCRHIEGITN